MTKQAKSIILSSVIVIVCAAILIVLVSWNNISPQEEAILGNWYAWYENGTDWKQDVMTFYNDFTYQTSSGEGIKNTYRLDKDMVYLEGAPFFRSLIMENQNGQPVLKADNEWVYYRTEEAAQTDLDRRASEAATQQDAPAKQEEPVQQEGGVRQEVAVEEKKVSEDILGNWTNKANVSLDFYEDSRYMMIDAERNVKIGDYRLLGPHTMIITDPDTRSEKEIEFTLTVVPYEDGSDQFSFSSHYFEWAGTFYRYQYYDFD